MVASKKSNIGSTTSATSKIQPLESLLMSYNFKVIAVKIGQKTRNITPRSEMYIGGESPYYESGLFAYTELEVSCKDKSIPINTLIFDGYAFVDPDTEITAKIPMYADTSDGDYRSLGLTPNEWLEAMHNKTYVARQPNEKEEAIEISTHQELKVIRSSNYGAFMQKVEENKAYRARAKK